MEFLAPFWDLLFPRCDLKTQVSLLNVCHRVHAVGMSTCHVMQRLRLRKHCWQRKQFPNH